MLICPKNQLYYKGMKSLKQRITYFFLKRYLIVPFLIIVLAGSAFSQIQFGVDSLVKNLSSIRGKRFALCANHTSRLADGCFLPDFLLSKDLIPEVIFTPEHGLRGNIGAGEKIYHNFYKGIRVFSLYSESFSPPDSLLKNLDIFIYDVQDVGLRFYTYISTLKRIINSCEKNNVELWVLDRPNPLGLDIVEGPVLDMRFSSFVGASPIPIRYGMTVGEFVRMAVGEGWVKNVKYKVFPLKGVRRSMCFSDWQRDWINPSPNLRSFEALKSYAGMCLLEGTIVSEGRGTKTPFLNFGYPSVKIYNIAAFQNDSILSAITFSPVSSSAAKYPKFENEKCFGYSLQTPLPNSGMIFRTCNWIKVFYDEFRDKQDTFFIKSGKRYFIDLLMGTDSFRLYVEKNINIEELFNEWRLESEKFKEKSLKYYLY